MSLSIQQSIVEKFSFNNKTVRSCTVDGCECLVAEDVYLALGYKKENGKKAVQNLVPEKYKVRFGDVKFSHKQERRIFPLHPDTVLLKESGLYCFLLRCGKGKAEQFMDWVVETVLPREIRKLSKVIKEKDTALALLTDDLQDQDMQIANLMLRGVACKFNVDT